MKILLVSVAALLGLIVVITMIGLALPVNHVAQSKALIKVAQQDVWNTITDVQHFPTWRSDVKTVGILPPRAGHFAWREEGSNGKIAYEQMDAVSPGLLRIRIADESLPFGGSWTYDLRQASGGTEVTITENGTVRNPLFRFASRFVFGYYRTQETFLRDLAKHFHQSVTPVRV